MGLKERQEIARITADDVPGHNTRLEEITGSAIVFDNDWSTFENDLDAIYGVNGMMLKVINAFQWVSRDEIGKKAIVDKIQRVVIARVDSVDQKTMQLEDGTLRLHTVLSGDDWDGLIGDNELIAWLENTL